jgi:hypothetical protein
MMTGSYGERQMSEQEKFIALVFEWMQIKERSNEIWSELDRLRRRASYEQLLEIKARLEFEANNLISKEERARLNVMPRIGDEPSDDDDLTFDEFTDGIDRQASAQRLHEHIRIIKTQLKQLELNAKRRAQKVTEMPKAPVTKFEPKR